MCVWKGCSTYFASTASDLILLGDALVEAEILGKILCLFLHLKFFLHQQKRFMQKPVELWKLRLTIEKFAN